MELVVDPRGTVRTIYTEELDLASLGPLTIMRASHVEPDDTGRWWVDLSPIGGPSLGPFDCRSAALQAEHDWIAARLGDTSWSPSPHRYRNGLVRWPKSGPPLKGPR